MRTDRAIKVLLALIAIALWMNALNPWLNPAPVSAQGGHGPASGHIDDNTGYDTHAIREKLEAIYDGTCKNRKLC